MQFAKLSHCDQLKAVATASLSRPVLHPLQCPLCISPAPWSLFQVLENEPGSHLFPHPLFSPSHFVQVSPLHFLHFRSNFTSPRKSSLTSSQVRILCFVWFIEPEVFCQCRQLNCSHLCCSLMEGLMMKLKLQYFGCLMQRADIGNDSDAGKDWRQKAKEVAEDEIIR